MKNILLGILSFVGVVLLQVFVFNQVNLWGYGCLFFHIIFIIVSPLRIKAVALMPIAFALGLAVDIFTHSYGIHAFAATLVAAIRANIINLYFSKEDLEHRPNLFVSFSYDYYKYAVSLILIYCLVVFSIEALSFSLIFNVLQKTLVSTVITAIVLFFTQSVVFKKYNER